MLPSTTQISKAVHNPMQAMEYLSKRAYRNASVALTSRRPFGTNIFSKDWDVYIVLDTLRIDALKSLSDEYHFVDGVDNIWSVGGCTPEWIAHTFDSKYRADLADTAYLSSNAWAEQILGGRIYSDDGLKNVDSNRMQRFGKWNPIQASGLGRFERIWSYVPKEKQIERQHEVDNELVAGGTPPRYVTDRGIAVARNCEYDRMILHYTQPHHPYLANALSEGRDLRPHETQPFAHLQETGDRETVWNAYLDEVRWVLDDVRILLNNTDADTVIISADHGDAFGEYGIFGHHAGSLNPYIRQVPWVVTSAADKESYSPEVKPREQNDMGVEERLQHLGYRV